MYLSNRYVRAMNDHAFCSENGSASAICCPRSPASARANGSWNAASGRSFSRARYTATQRAVSEISRINGSMSTSALPSPGHDVTIARRADAAEQHARPRMDHHRLHRSDAARIPHIEHVSLRRELRTDRFRQHRGRDQLAEHRVRLIRIAEAVAD